MYWTTPSGTRYQTGSDRSTRARQSVELMAMAGTSWRLTLAAGRPRLRQDVARAGDPDEVGQVEQLVRVLPGQDLGERVGTGDEEQLVVRTLLLQVAQGVDRVGRSRPVDVDAADREPGVGGRRDDGHEVAVLGRADLPGILLPGLSRGDEDDLVEPEPGLHLGGGHEVAVVDRVERPAHHPETHAQWWPPCGAPWSRLTVLDRTGERLRGAAEAPEDPEQRQEGEEGEATEGVGRHGQLAGLLLGGGEQVRQRRRHGPQPTGHRAGRLTPVVHRCCAQPCARRPS